MEARRAPRGYWTKERIIETALKCQSRAEFIGLYASAYSTASAKGWLGAINNIWENGKRPNGFWTKERVFSTARKCKTKKEFRTKHESAYQTAITNEWLTELNAEIAWVVGTGDKLSRAVYAIISKTRNDIYIGLSYDVKKRYERGHRGSSASKKVKELIRGEHYLEQLTDYVDFRAAQLLEAGFVNEFKRLGWNIINDAKTGSLGSPISAATFSIDDIKAQASRYKNKTEFKNGNKLAYNAARKHNGLLDNLFYAGRRKKWTIGLVREFVAKEGFKDQKQLRKKSPSIYNIASNNGWLDEIFPNRRRHRCARRNGC